MSAEACLTGCAVSTYRSKLNAGSKLAASGSPEYAQRPEHGFGWAVGPHPKRDSQFHKKGRPGACGLAPRAGWQALITEVRVQGRRGVSGKFWKKRTLRTHGTTGRWYCGSLYLAKKPCRAVLAGPARHPRCLMAAATRVSVGGVARIFAACGCIVWFIRQCGVCMCVRILTVRVVPPSHL